MSGGLSLFRESVALFYPAMGLPQEGVFRFCILLAFILAMGVLYWQEHSEKEALKKLIDTRIPQVKGTILQVQINPALDRTADTEGDVYVSESSIDTWIAVYVKLVSSKDTSATVDRFELAFADPKGNLTTASRVRKA